MKNTRIVFIWLGVGVTFGFSINKPRSFNDQAYTQTISFDGSVYPGSCIQKARACTMQIWTSARKAVCSYEEQARFERELDLFLDTVLKIHGYVQGLVESPEEQKSVSQDEKASLIRLLGEVERYFDIVMFGRVSDQASCIKVILNMIQKKIEQMSA